MFNRWIYYYYFLFYIYYIWFMFIYIFIIFYNLSGAMNVGTYLILICIFISKSYVYVNISFEIEIVKLKVNNSICVILRQIFWDIKFEYRFSNAHLNHRFVLQTNSNRHHEISIINNVINFKFNKCVQNFKIINTIQE